MPVGKYKGLLEEMTLRGIRVFKKEGKAAPVKREYQVTRIRQISIVSWQMKATRDRLKISQSKM